MDESMDKMEMAEETGEAELDSAGRAEEEFGWPEDDDAAELLYGTDAAPGRNLKEVIRAGVNSGLTERDRNTLMKFRELAEQVPQTIAEMMRNDDLPAMARIRLIELVLDRAYGKAEATVNVNGNLGGLEAAEMRVEAMVRSLKLEGNPYGDE